MARTLDNQVFSYPSSTALQSNGDLCNASFATSPSDDSLFEAPNDIADHAIMDSDQATTASTPPPVDHYHDRCTLNTTPGFLVPGLSTSPGPAGSSWNVPQSSSPPLIHSELPPAAQHSYAAQQPLHQTDPSLSPSFPYPGSASTPSDPLNSALASLSFSDTQTKGPDSNGPPALTAPLPTIASLIAGLSSVHSGNSPASSVVWCRDVLGLVDLLYMAPSQNSSPDRPPTRIQVAH